jgi:hypothetical protein
MLTDVITRMREYAMALHVPTLVLFSMGTIVPLMVISLFPIVSLFGFEISPATITMFLVLSLIGCFVYSTMVLKKRPSTLSLPGSERAEDREQSRYAGSLAIAAAVILSFPSVLYIVSLSSIATLYGPVLWLAETLGGLGMVWGVGLAVSIYTYMTSSTKKGFRKKLKELEEQFIDALYHIKNRLSDGRPIESALEFSASTLGDLPVSVYIRSVLKRMKRKNVTLEVALKEEKTESGLIKFVFKMLINSLKGGRKAASQTASVIYEYVTKIQTIEKEMTTLLSKPLSMMKATVMFFAPLVCGIIVVLFQMITKTIEKTGKESLGGYGMEGLFMAPMINPTTLQLIVGLYTIALNYVLLRYVSRIQSGSDNIAFKADMARAIPITLIIFTATLLTASMVLLR